MTNPPEQNWHLPIPHRLGDDAKESLIAKVVETLGHDVPHVRSLLKTLAHPDVIEHTKRYFNAMDKSSMCTKYEAPWSCAREVEARYENIQFGWLGGGGGVGFDESWCDNCRKKILGE